MCDRLILRELVREGEGDIQTSIHFLAMFFFMAICFFYLTAAAAAAASLPDCHFRPAIESRLERREGRRFKNEENSLLTRKKIRGKIKKACEYAPYRWSDRINIF